jgi:hypothetical protein
MAEMKEQGSDTRPEIGRAPDYPAIIPNAVTIAAMNEPAESRRSFISVAALMADLHADD